MLRVSRGVVRSDNISWPTRGPNAEATIVGAKGQDFAHGRVAYAIQCHLEPSLEEIRECFAGSPQLVTRFESRHGPGLVEAFFEEYALSLARRQFARKMIGQVRATEHTLTLLDRDGRRARAHIRSVALHDHDHTTVGVLGAIIPEAEPTSSDAQAPGLSPKPKLTPRQFETLRLLGDGLSTTEIATQLGVSNDTARNHVRAVLSALERTRACKLSLPHNNSGCCRRTSSPPALRSRLDRARAPKTCGGGADGR